MKMNPMFQKKRVSGELFDLLPGLRPMKGYVPYIDRQHPLITNAENSRSYQTCLTEKGEPVLLGKGGQGCVWQAVIVGKPDEFVAIKELADNHGYWQKEWTALNSLKDEDILIPKMLDYFDFTATKNQRERSYKVIVMQCIDGQSLQPGHLTSELHGYYLLLDCLYTLQKVHERGLIHRDIKPDNIVASAKGYFIVDFGICKEKGGGPHTQVGSELFVAPEVRKNLGDWSDIFSLGATLVSLLITDEVFDRFGLKLFECIDECPVSHGMKQILRKMMAHEVTQRYQNCTQVIQDLLTVPIGRLDSKRADSLIPACDLFKDGFSSEAVAQNFLLGSLDLLKEARKRNFSHGFLTSSHLILDKKTRDVKIIGLSKEGSSEKDDVVALGKAFKQLVQNRSNTLSQTVSSHFTKILEDMCRGDKYPTFADVMFEFNGPEGDLDFKFDKTGPCSENRRRPTCGMSRDLGGNIFYTGENVRYRSLDKDEEPSILGGHFRCAFGICVDYPYIFVSDTDHVRVFDADSKKKITRFGKPGSTGIAISRDGHVLVANSEDCKVQKWSYQYVDGKLTFKLETQYDVRSQEPLGLVVGPSDGKIVISSITQRKIVGDPKIFSLRQALDIDSPNPTWQVIGKDVLIQPTGIAIDWQGRIVVADSAAHKVFMFDQFGKELARFGDWWWLWASAHQLDCPQVVLYAKGKIIVGDRSNELKVFAATPKAEALIVY